MAKVLTNRHSANTFLTSGDYKKKISNEESRHPLCSNFVPNVGETFKDVCHSLVLARSKMVFI